MKRIVFLILVLTLSLQSFSQRKMEKLERGLVAVRKSGSEVFLSWRIYGLEFNDSVNFNLYRNDALIASNLNVSNYVETISTNGSYQVAPVVKGVEQKKSAPVGVTTYLHGSNSLPSLKVPIKNTAGYTTQCLWVGDLDGDGEYDFVLCKINWADNTPLILEAYTRHGDYLWTLNCGPNSYNKDNISPGSSALCMGHGDNLTVYDINNDGFAEVLVRTANGVIFGDGTVLKETNNNKQFISVLEGTTGKEISRAAVPTDFLSVGPLNGHMGIAYLDGVNPSVVYSAKNRRADKGFNMLVATWKWQNDSLLLNWKFNRETSGLALPDGHNIRIIDVDSDGKDEITPFGYSLDEDGSVLYNLGSKGVVHGDRFFIGDMDTTHAGLEGYGIQQSNSNGLIWYYYDAKTGQILQKQVENPIIANDYARGFAGDLDPRYPGYEFFTFTDGLYNVNGSRITTSKPDSYPNLRIWWDGDLLSENLDNLKMTKWDYIANIDNSEIRLYTFSGIIQDPRKTPAFYGDIMGDWREEAVYASSDGNSILIFTTVTPTNTRLYTLPHNPGYRNCFNVRGYYQGHMTDFYLGNGMATPPTPEIAIVNDGKGRKLSSGMFFIKAEHSGMYLDTVSGVSQQSKNDSKGQVWEVKSFGELYTIYSPGTESYLSYQSSTYGSGLLLSDSASLFRIVEATDNKYLIALPDDSTLIVTVKDSSLTEGGKLEWQVNSGQEFEFLITANYFDCNNDWKGTAKNDNCDVCSGGNTGYLACATMKAGLYKIKEERSGLCLQQTGDKLIQEVCSETSAQVWKLVSNVSGGYYITNEGSKKYLNFNPVTNGSEILLGDEGQLIRFEKKSGSSYFIKSQVEPGMGFRASENSLAEGTGIVLDDTQSTDSNTFIFESFVTGIGYQDNNLNLEIYPNPVCETVYLRISGQGGNKYLLDLFDNVGNKVFSTNLGNGLNTIDLNELPSGVYYAKIVSDQKSKVLKIIKE